MDFDKKVPQIDKKLCKQTTSVKALSITVFIFLRCFTVFTIVYFAIFTFIESFKVFFNEFSPCRRILGANFECFSHFLKKYRVLPRIFSPFLKSFKLSRNSPRHSSTIFRVLQLVSRSYLLDICLPWCIVEYLERPLRANLSNLSSTFLESSSILR